MRLPNRAATWSAAALLAFSLHAVAQRPAAPQVTVGADLKVLRFDWDPVAGATFYRLSIKTGNSPYRSVGGVIPASTTHAQDDCISVHLLDWERTHYVVSACNGAGCTNSAPIVPQSLMLETIGYFKASNTDPGDFFGREVVLSDDGRTLAVAAENESSAATGVNGDQADNSSPGSGAVYIFRRTGSGWRQEAYLKPPVNRSGIRFGTGLHAIALSSSGSIAVIGASAQDAGGFGFAGEVYVFGRGSNGWRHTATVRPPVPQTADFFGYSVDLSLDGRTLKVNSLQPQDPEVNHEGRTHIFRRNGSTWQFETTIAPFYAGDFCPMVRMSGDGRTLVSSCYSLAETFRAVTLKRIGDTWVHTADLELTRYNSQRPLALNFDGTSMALGLVSNFVPEVGVYRWNGSGWVSEGRISQSGVPSVAFGISLALDRVGNRLAIGDFVSTAGGAGVSRTLQPGGVEHGAVFLYQRNGAQTSPWRLRSVIKAPNPGKDLFGAPVSLSGSGRTLAVGAIREGSNARGIDGDQTDESAPDAGAAYLY